MTTAMDRQPTKLDYASPTQFKFSIMKLPKVEYFCTSANIPGIALADTQTQPTPLKDIPLPGDRLNYERLSISFLVVDEDIYRWSPSLLISTIDKFAQIAWNETTSSIFGKTDHFCLSFF